MRRTRSRKTHKRHAKRHTRRCGGNGNGPSAAAGNNTTARKPIITNNEGLIPNPNLVQARKKAMNAARGKIAALEHPMPPYLSFFKVKKNKGFAPVAAALPIPVVAPPANTPMAKKNELTININKLTPNPHNEVTRRHARRLRMGPWPPHSAVTIKNGKPIKSAFNIGTKNKGFNPANNQMVKSKVAPLPSSPFSPTSGY